VKSLLEQLMGLRADRDAEVEKLFEPTEPVDWDSVSDEDLLDSLKAFGEYIMKYEYTPYQPPVIVSDSAWERFVDHAREQGFIPTDERFISWLYNDMWRAL